MPLIPTGSLAKHIRGTKSCWHQTVHGARVTDRESRRLAPREVAGTHFRVSGIVACLRFPSFSSIQRWIATFNAWLVRSSVVRSRWPVTGDVFFTNSHSSMADFSYVCPSHCTIIRKGAGITRFS